MIKALLTIFKRRDKRYFLSVSVITMYVIGAALQVNIKIHAFF